MTIKFNSTLKNSAMPVSVEVTAFYCGYDKDAILKLLKNGNASLTMNPSKESHSITLKENNVVIARCTVSFEPVEVCLETASFNDDTLVPVERHTTVKALVIKLIDDMTAKRDGLISMRDKLDSRISGYKDKIASKNNAIERCDVQLNEYTLSLIALR